MAVLRIARMGNPVLLEPSAPVEDPTAPEIRRLAQDMQETIEDIGASGLAAPQVFVPKRVVVYRMIASRIPEGSGLEPRPWTVMVNPVIRPKAKGKRDVWERCLSVPGLHGKVPRYLHIDIAYQDLGGRHVTHEARNSDAHDGSRAARLQRRARTARARGRWRCDRHRSAVYRSRRALAGARSMVRPLTLHRGGSFNACLQGGHRRVIACFCISCFC